MAGTDEAQPAIGSPSRSSADDALYVQDTEKTDSEKPHKSDTASSTDDASDRDSPKQSDSEDDRQPGDAPVMNSAEASLPETSARPGVDRVVAGRFIDHAIGAQALPSDTKRKLQLDEVEERLENGRAAPRHHLPEIRQVVKGGGWPNEDDSDSSDEEDLKVFD